MVASQLLAALVVIFTVSLASGQNSTGMQYTGQPAGYIACPSDDVQECQLGVNQNCSAQELISCNVTIDILPTFSDDRMTAYIPLLCECAIATDCASTCTFTEGDVPTSPPGTGSVGTENFTGVGSVHCFTADLLNTPCRPRIDNLASCGLCDVTALTDNVTENQFGDEFITFPLLCECFVMTDCPDTCNFTSGPANLSSSAYENHGLWCTVTTIFGIFSLIALFL